MFRKAEMVYFLYRNKEKYTSLESGHLRKEQPRKSDVAVIAWIFQKTVTVSLISVDSLSFTGAVKPPNSILCGIHAFPGRNHTLLRRIPGFIVRYTALICPLFPKGGRRGPTELGIVWYASVSDQGRRQIYHRNRFPFLLLGFIRIVLFIMWFSGWQQFGSVNHQAGPDKTESGKLVNFQ